ncbi:MAG TPA: glycosyltransferase [Terriglobales bacterium]|nr:glycosyltransferase [Terriglobales bacterium]
MSVLEMPLQVVDEELPPAGQEDSSVSQPSHTDSRGYWDWVFCLAIICGLAFLVYASLHDSLFRPVWLAAEHHRWGKLMFRPSVLWMAMGAGLLIFRTIFWFRYRPFPASSLADAPHLTVVIPAYNEGPMVLKSIESVATALYPHNRLEIFVVDDGSKDDTWLYIQRAASRYPHMVTTFRQPKNKGKRAALAVGFERARGEVIVTLDSDSVIEPNALLAITGPFRDPKVGAVAGKVEVYNRRSGIIPRMLHVQYILSFDLMRAVESSYGTVYCCPGALTAYRTSIVRRVLPAWMEQKFLGSRCTFGEDRAMTNMVLSQGYDTVYQRSAQVRTVVPENYMKMCKMFLRWDRSYVREEINFMRIVWKRPLVPRIISVWERITSNLRYPVHYFSLIMLGALAYVRPGMIPRMLLAIGVVSLFNMIYYLRSERSKDFVYGVLYGYFSFFLMFWIFPYAVLTVRARGWLTR